ncbi:MAG TPA: magnesium transporter [Vicinamibacterales bacterium]|nr:magnesium transporter [Vicinamibacterales bacterium]
MSADTDRLAALLSSGDTSTLRTELLRWRLQDVAVALTSLPLPDEVRVLDALPPRAAAAIFEYLPPAAQTALSSTMPHDHLAALLNDMAPDDRTEFLARLPADTTERLLTLLNDEERAEAEMLLQYPPGTVGRLMTPHYVAVPEGWTIREVLDYIRAHGEDKETLNVIYVIDERGTLIDDLRIRQLLLVSSDKRIADIMDRQYVALRATQDQASAIDLFRKEDRTALPVVNDAGTLIGTVTVDDVLDAAQELATREFQQFGGSEALDEPYMQASLARMIRKRAGWLVFLFLGEMLTATAMGFFEQEIARAVVLALFVPLIISSGGNSGSQASTLVIRALAVGEVGLRDWWRVMRREIFSGLALGSILGAIGFLRISIWSVFSNLYGPHWLLVAVTVASALVGVVLWGTLVGSILPFVLRRLGFDPATSSAPFVATLVDVTGLVIYFSVALVTLRGTLL